MKVDVIAVPYDSGRHDARMGRGPNHLLELGLVDVLQSAGAEVRVHHVAPASDVFPAEIRMAFDLQRVVAEHVAAARRGGAFPLVLSGNCNTAVGTVAGVHAATGALPVVCWFDAHADFNTPETTIGGFLDGMAVAMLTGRCWRTLTAQVPGFCPVPESDVVLIGTRDVDPLERELLAASAIRVRTAQLADGRLDARTVAASVGAGGREMYVHVDLDVLDPSEGRANGYAVPGGLSRATLLAVLGSIQAAGVIGAAALTAYDPDQEGADAVARVALEIARQLVSRPGTSHRVT